MPALNQNSPDALCAEILATARRESEEIENRAKTEAAALVAAAQADAEKLKRERLEQGQADAARRKELILATVAVETGRMRSARLETLLESVHQSIRGRLQADGFDRHSTIVALATEAIRRMPDSSFVLKLSPADQAAFGSGLAGEITQRAGRPSLSLAVSADATLTGGVTIRDAGGFQYWDNRLLSRLERLWPELRQQIAVCITRDGEKNSPGGNK
jgi:vacuolar-type H+-ATPase subunit E/Vma4